MDRATPSSVSSVEAGLEEDDSLTRPGIRTPARGTGANGSLETVRENSLPANPAIGTIPSQYNGKIGDLNRPSTIEENPMEEVLSKGDKTSVESGSESGGNKSTGNKNESKDRQKVATNFTTAKPPTMMPRRSHTQLNSRSKVGEGSVKNMTVETETVSSVPQVAVGGGTGERGLPGRTDTGSSLRLKASNETIRPRKERKKTTRKAPSINSGTGGSLFNRRYHHHHLYSRAEPLKPISSLSLISPQFPPAYIPEQLHLTFTQLPSISPKVRTPCTTANLTTTHVNLKMNRSSSTLTGFRARTASSKADIFEAKVANAVGQADSSDSDETFVYESNPPEPLSGGRLSRYHSRTPSVTSTASQADHYAGRARQDGHHSIAGKKSMKFANSSYHINGHGENGENTFGSSHGNSGRMTGGNTSHHHHVGRHGRSIAGHTSLFDNDSPFPNASKPLRTVAGNTTRMSPRPASPRSPQIVRLSTANTKANTPLIYDLEGEGADDERTPLIGSMRAGRNRNSRRPGARQAEYDGSISHGYCKRITGCILLGGLVGFLIAAVVVALIMSSKPLMDVHVKDIQNVLASEQEIMLDLHVHAINPNIVAIQVNDLDINVFAKSKHVGTNALWRDSHPSTKPGQNSHIRQASKSPTSMSPGHPDSGSEGYNTTDGVDEGNDPIKDPESDSQTMLLGRILDFDSPLIFDASPIRHQSLSSVGEVRLAKPGNGTEEGGSDRWEKVIQYPFELIVRGVLRYSLPISSRIRSASIGGSVTVLPEDGIGSSAGTIAARMIEASIEGSNPRPRKPGLRGSRRIKVVV